MTTAGEGLVAGKETTVPSDDQFGGVPGERHEE